MQEQLPGVLPILHQGKISGAFDLLASDMAQIEFEGRVMLVLVADVDQVTVKSVKGDQTAFWTFKGADAAIVRDAGMKELLADKLHLESMSPVVLTADVVRGATLTGVYGDEGEFLGFQPADLDHGEHPDRPDYSVPVDPETGEVLGGEDVETPVLREEEEDSAPFKPTVAPHIRHRDSRLEAFLNEPAHA